MAALAGEKTTGLRFQGLPCSGGRSCPRQEYPQSDDLRSSGAYRSRTIPSSESVNGKTRSWKAKNRLRRHCSHARKDIGLSALPSHSRRRESWREGRHTAGSGRVTRVPKEICPFRGRIRWHTGHTTRPPVLCTCTRSLSGLNEVITWRDSDSSIRYVSKIVLSKWS